MDIKALVSAVTKFFGSAFMERVKAHFVDAALESVIDFLQKMLDGRQGEGGPSVFAV